MTEAKRLMWMLLKEEEDEEKIQGVSATLAAATEISMILTLIEEQRTALKVSLSAQAAFTFIPTDFGKSYGGFPKGSNSCLQTLRQPIGSTEPLLPGSSGHPNLTGLV